MLQQIEDGLVAQLARAFTRAGDARPWLKVEAWPVRPEGYRLAGSGDVFVIYRGTRYRIEDTSSKFCNAALEYEITLRARNLRDNGGAYAMIEAARDATCGNRLDGAAGVTTPVHDGFIDYGEGVFAYSLIVAVPVLVVQTGEDRAPGPWLDGDAEYAELEAVRFQLDGVRLGGHQ